MGVTREWQRKHLEGWYERRAARREGATGWLASSSCRSAACSRLTVNIYYILNITRMNLGREVCDSRGARTINNHEDPSSRPAKLFWTRKLGSGEDRRLACYWLACGGFVVSMSVICTDLPPPSATRTAIPLDSYGFTSSGSNQSKSSAESQSKTL